MSTPGHIHLHTDGPIARIVIDNQSKRNALTSAMRGQLLNALRQVDDTDTTRVTTITGAGNSFCSGGDINVLKDLKARGDEAGFIQILEDGKAIINSILNSPKPFIAIVNGPASGAGLFIALACDMRVCGQSGSFGGPLIKRGLGLDWGCAYLLPRLVGRGKAMQLMLLGETVTGDDTIRYGLANYVWPDPELQARADNLARVLASHPRNVVAYNKHALNASWHMSFEETLDLERRLQILNFRSPDFEEGIAAFLEKREPGFQ